MLQTSFVNRNMLRVLVAAGLCLLFANNTSCQRRVCYYNRAAASRAPIGTFTPSQIDPNLCTHIMFGFAEVSNQNELVVIGATDITLYAELNNLKSSNPQLITLLAVGGPDVVNNEFPSMVSSVPNRAKFVTSAVTFLHTHGFNGLNLDWRYPSSKPERTRFGALCQELRAAFIAASPALMLTASVSADQAVIDDAYDAAVIEPELDFFNVLTFDFHGTSSPTALHHSPLGAHSTTSSDTLTTKYGMEYWENTLNVPPAKLNLGIAAHGVAFTLTDPATNGVGAAVTTSDLAEEGCYGLVPGIWSYYDTCLYIQGGDVNWIASQSVPYAVTEGQWVGYDNLASLDAKVAYMKANSYGGVCVWSLDLDDFTGQFCNNGTNPFFTHLKSIL